MATSLPNMTAFAGVAGGAWVVAGVDGAVLVGGALVEVEFVVAVVVDGVP